VQRVRRRYATQLALLPAGAPRRASMASAYASLRAEGLEVGAALRVTRHLVLERLAVLDCEQHEPLESITRAMTELAEWALNIACEQAREELDAVHGAPLTPQGQRAQWWVVGMGKLGARELNVSSDIDLIYVYDSDGESAGTALGRGRISNQEYFAKAVKRLFGLIGESTEHGQVFRVDLALRPNGQAGPPAVSLDALEQYFQIQGREWERFAWLKSRVVAPTASLRDPAVQALRSVVLPFVFRRYLDYGVFDALRQLHRQIRAHAAQLAAGRPERANDVKMSRGGIREIEFIVQLLQVVRAGQFPELRTRSTLDALTRLAHAGLMPAAAAQAMAQAYQFLRRVEHRIQYLDDQQTHALPTQDEDLQWVARTMGSSDTSLFLSELNLHRERVALEFDTLLGGASTCVACCASDAASDGASPNWGRLLSDLPPRFRERVQAWQTHPRVLALRDDARVRLWRWVQRTAQWLREGQVDEEGAVRIADWMEPLLRRESYLALLLERPRVHKRLMRLLGAARWPARYLLRHPGVIDELADDTMLEERFSATAFEAEVQARRQALESTAEADDEALLNLLRRAHHAEVFRTLARDVEGCISVEQVADDLSLLADTVLRITARWCWLGLKNRHRPEPYFAIIGYGKLGGKELGYGSDLDIVFVYDDEDEQAAATYTAWVRKLINWLTLKTAEGDLYEIDTALRPNGNSGLLVTRFEAYANYQQQRGSNTAWTWEHQAMTRARCVLGADRLAQRFEAVRQAVITAPRDRAALRSQIMAMRERVHQAHPVPTGFFDVKHSSGGMVDAEFVVQYLVLSHSHQHPALRANIGNIALLHTAQACGLLPAPTGDAAADAYRNLRRVQHHARLNEEPTQVASDTHLQDQQAILSLWRTVFA